LCRRFDKSRAWSRIIAKNPLKLAKDLTVQRHGIAALCHGHPSPGNRCLTDQHLPVWAATLPRSPARWGLLRHSGCHITARASGPPTWSRRSPRSARIRWKHPRRLRVPARPRPLGHLTSSVSEGSWAVWTQMAPWRPDRCRPGRRPSAHTRRLDRLGRQLRWRTRCRPVKTRR